MREVNRPPVFAAVPDQFVDELDEWEWMLSATDPDLPTNRLQYSLIRGPAGLTVGGNGRVRWSPSEEQGPAVEWVEVRVTDDGVPALSATNGFTITVREVNSAPVLLSPGLQWIDELGPWRLALLATDRDWPPNRLTFGLVRGPDGLTVAPDGEVRWTPSELQGPSTNEVVVKVTDDGPIALSATNRFVIRVREVNAPPVMAPLADRDVFFGERVTVLVLAEDPDGPLLNRLTFELVPPEGGATVDPDTGVFRWVADRYGSHRFTIRVRDDGIPSASDQQSFNIRVADPRLDVRLHGGRVVFEFETRPQWNYQLMGLTYRAAGAGSTTWRPVLERPIRGTGSREAVTLPPDAIEEGQLIRLEITPANPN